MGQNTSVIRSVPGREEMIRVIDAILAFEDKAKHGESLTRTEEAQKRALEPVARALLKAQQKSVLFSKVEFRRTR